MRVTLVAAALLGGCGFFYKPVPIANAIGKERTALAGDSFNVHRDPRFEVYGPGSRAVFDAYEQLNRTYRAFDRYFGAPTPHLTAVLYPELTKARDTAAVHALRESGATVLRFVRPIRSSYRERGGDDGYEGSLWPVGPVAVRLLLAATASATAAVDTNSLSRFPAWYRAAVIGIAGDGTALPMDIQYMKENRGNRLTVDQLVAADRPTSADSTLDPYRRDDADDRDRAFASQSTAFMQFLSEREGALAIGTLGRGFVRGETFAQQASAFRVLPHTTAELEERWLAWLAAQRPIY